ncbi:hypothetical protein GCM10009534_50290 [Kribbella sandramycini]
MAFAVGSAVGVGVGVVVGNKGVRVGAVVGSELLPQAVRVSSRSPVVTVVPSLITYCLPEKKVVRTGDSR